MTASQYRIRSLHAADRQPWEVLWQSYLQFYQSSLAATATELLWQRLLDPAHEIQGRVAVGEAGGLAGLVHFFPHAHTWYAAPVCYLNDLFVVAEIRGGGIGEQLIAAVVSEARQRGWCEVYWHTQQQNSIARGLYDKITGGTDGFVNYTIDLSGGRD